MTTNEIKQQIKTKVAQQGNEGAISLAPILEAINNNTATTLVLRLGDASKFADLPKTIKADNISTYFEKDNNQYPTWIDAIIKDVINAKKFVPILSNEGNGEEQMLKMAYNFALQQLTLALPAGPLFGSHEGIKLWLQGDEIELSWAES